MKNKLMLIVLVAMILSLTGCYSIFSGGTSGRVVDADSTSNPKDGIANVDVYAYTSKWEMEKDYKNWSGGRFSPESKKYAHTITTADGSFTISKVMWKSMLPTYWRDGDTATAYILFYHEDYGLVKGDKAMLLSDTISDSVYQELRAVRQRTNLVLSIIDVATNRPTDRPMNVRITVPGSRTYEATITGTGTVPVSYPRGTTPDVSVTFSESAQKVSFKMCKDGTTDNNWSFSEEEYIITGISGDRYSAEVYGKKCIVNPVFSGKTTGDGVKVTLKYNDEEIDTTYTNYRILGDTVEHGHYSGLGSGYEWDTGTYIGKTVSRVFSVNGNTVTVSSGQPNVVFNF